MTDTIESLRAERDLLFDALNLHMRKTGITNEAMERVEAFRAVVDANEPLVRGECTRLAKGWNDAAAACAEMRAALEHYAHREYESRRDADGQIQHIAAEVLARPDLGVGKVLVAGPLDALVDNLVRVVCDCHDGSDLWAHTRRDPEAFRRAVRGALLKKGGG